MQIEDAKDTSSTGMRDVAFQGHAVPASHGYTAGQASGFPLPFRIVPVGSRLLGSTQLSELCSCPQCSPLPVCNALVVPIEGPEALHLSLIHISEPTRLALI
eukprot:2818093-Alexandrium_andersonii.AAC.1